MRILVFLHGTLIMHRSGTSRSREERVLQSKAREASVRDYASYIPIGDAVAKLNIWQRQGAEILYLSSRTQAEDLVKDAFVLQRHGFPKARVCYRQGQEHYKDVVARVKPDILIEDDCESIGGAPAMTITDVDPKLKEHITSIVVKEFGGIDHLPDDLAQLAPA